jgi:hypothetical protein
MMTRSQLPRRRKPDTSAALVSMLSRRSGEDPFILRELLEARNDDALDHFCPVLWVHLEGRARIAKFHQDMVHHVRLPPQTMLPDGLGPMVATATERARYPQSVIESRVLFSIKEAAFKASYPFLGRFLDFHDIEVNLEARRAYIGSGRWVPFSFIINEA